jgi:hypothetical protein
MLAILLFVGSVSGSIFPQISQLVQQNQKEGVFDVLAAGDHALFEIGLSFVVASSAHKGYS